MTIDPTCDAAEHDGADHADVDVDACRDASAIFRALGDPGRMQIVVLLLRGEMCVTEIAAVLNDNLPAVSQRLKLLRGERVVAHRREGKHVFYSLADDHIAELVTNGIAHAREDREPGDAGREATAATR